jgi:mannose-6-phosphate isomerase-like protein (cupin superfamily)
MHEQRAKVADYLPQLNEAVAQLISRPLVHSLIDDLKQQLPRTAEPFVWSCWIFVLKKDVPSGCHFHPNSIQHMVMIEGEGTSKIGDDSRHMKRFADPDSSLENIWYVIPEGTPHEFFPAETDVVVVSFHTCTSDELEEVSCDSGATRTYA